ncbi:DUF1934 domain-containing protein [Neobacillus kokaensis]|uniref:Beta-barrel protein YwiB n=1 Tax=Neobacillus kokaensis TaxID=2759023 RepID=A0ABQ3N974_9BACI|nr:DUF1934 domain-containing protein [Neobacillus kokaensis]GHH97961.1 putative beta-barrel protein YwiB [Neobacillus kokaensis]
MTTNEIPVKVTVKTTIDEADPMELVVFGRYFQKGNASYLKYEEVMEELGTVRTIVKISEEEMLILRSGAIKMRLPFQLQKKLNGSYEMPFGVFETATLAQKMEFTDGHVQGGGQIDIVYDFEMQGSPAGTYQLKIQFHPVHMSE